MIQSNSFFWQQPGWFDQVSAWIDRQLSGLGLVRAGPLTQPHARPWSTVLQVPTSNGALFFKASAPALAHEIAVTRWLAGQFPDCILSVLAADPEHAWMLLPDGGSRLREILRAEGSLQRWESVLVRYAELQIGSSQYVSDLLALAVPDRRIQELPDLYLRVLADEPMLLIDQPDGLTAAQVNRLQQVFPRLFERCQELGAFAIPAGIQHGDFHDGNIFIKSGRNFFFDWGDCSISHPFFSLRTTFVSLENTFGLVEGSADFDRLRDVYLERWTKYASRAELLGIFDLSRRLAPLCSVLSWQRAISTVSESLRGDTIYAVPSLLQEFLELNTDL